MNKLFKPGDCVVFVRKSQNDSNDFPGYDILECGKIYTVDFIFYEYISLVGIYDYGYQIDSFESLVNIRKEKLNEILD